MKSLVKRPGGGGGGGVIVPFRVINGILVPLRVFSLKRCTVGAFVVPFRVLGQKNITRDNVLF